MPLASLHKDTESLSASGRLFCTWPVFWPFHHQKRTDSVCLIQVQYTAYGEVYLDSNPEFQLVVGFHGGLYDPLTKLVHFTQRDYDVLAGRWTSPDYSIWPKIGKDPAPFNLYMFKNNNPLSDMLDVKNYVTGRGNSL